MPANRPPGSLGQAIPPRSKGEKKYSEGLALLKRGCSIEAVASLSRAVKLSRNHSDAWAQLGVALVGMDQSVKARDCFERSLSLSPRQPSLWSNYGVLMLLAGDAEKALHAFRQALVLQPNLTPARRNACLALYALGRDEEVQSILPNSPDRCILHGQDLREKGELEGATEAYREAIRLLDMNTDAAPKDQISQFSREGARKALLAAKERLDGAGIPFFLIDGTLLGVVREGDVLAHDKDLDIGMAWEVDRRDVVRGLCAEGLFTFPWEQGILPPDRLYYRSFIHSGSGCSLDTFFFRPEGGALVSGFDARPKPILSRLTAFGLRDWAWLGQTWKVPDPPERYLSEIYGSGWRTPDLHYNAWLSNPALIPESLPMVICMAYVDLYKAMGEQRWTCARALAAQILARREDPFLVDLKARIDNRLHNIQTEAVSWPESRPL